MRRVLVSAAVGGTIGAMPSTLAALVSGRDPLEATLAAGSILLPREHRRPRLVAAALPVHAALSVFWAAVLERALPRRGTVAWGAGAGVAIAALDLLVIGRRFARVRALPFGPQLADHVAYGAAVGFVLAREAA